MASEEFEIKSHGNPYDSNYYQRNENDLLYDLEHEPQCKQGRCNEAIHQYLLSIHVSCSVSFYLIPRFFFSMNTCASTDAEQIGQA
jgi:hypothetical protein